jgi:hypothetical protein
VGGVTPYYNLFLGNEKGIKKESHLRNSPSHQGASTCP